MTGEEFVKLCHSEKEAVLKLYFAEDSSTQVGAGLRKLMQNGVERQELYALVDLILSENYYSMLLALDGEASLGGEQIVYKLFDEEGNRLNECGELGGAAYSYFVEGTDE